MEGLNGRDEQDVPTSEVGSRGHLHEEQRESQSGSTNFLEDMEKLLTRLLTVPQQSVTTMTTQLIQFDADSPDADIEGWC